MRLAIIPIRVLLLPLAIAVALCACAHAPSAPADALAGAWRGTWTKGGDPIGVMLSIQKTPTGYSGSFDMDELQFAGIPFTRIETSGGDVTLVFAADEGPVTFEGQLTGGRLEGAFHEEGGVDGRFSLARDPSPPPALRTRDVSFANGDVTLAGTVMLPEAGGRRPTIIFVHGSGPEGRWGSRYLAQQFARRGFVALIFDKRGVGGSGGDWRHSGFDALAADAAAGVRLLASMAEVDPQRIGVYGHSQGGTIAPLLAALVDLRFVIVSAAMGESPADTEIYSFGNYIGIPRLAGAERAGADRYAREIVAVAYEGKPRDELDRLMAAYRDRSWYVAPPSPDSQYWSLSRMFSTYRPREAWARVRCPVLLVWGEKDERVNAAESAKTINDALAAAGNTRVTTRIYPNAEHTYRIVEPPPGNGWARRVPGVFEGVLSWAEAASAEH